MVGAASSSLCQFGFFYINRRSPCSLGFLDLVFVTFSSSLGAINSAEFLSCLDQKSLVRGFLLFQGTITTTPPDSHNDAVLCEKHACPPPQPQPGSRPSNVAYITTLTGNILRQIQDRYRAKVAVVTKEMTDSNEALRGKVTRVMARAETAEALRDASRKEKEEQVAQNSTRLPVTAAFFSPPTLATVALLSPRPSSSHPPLPTPINRTTSPPFHFHPPYPPSHQATGYKHL